MSREDRKKGMKLKKMKFHEVRLFIRVYTIVPPTSNKVWQRLVPPSILRCKMN